jgi:hypothetical protein
MRQAILLLRAALGKQPLGGGSPMASKLRTGQVPMAQDYRSDHLGPKRKSYKAYVFVKDFPCAIVETGQFEGDALVFRTEFSAGGTTLKLRNVTRVVSPGKLVSEEYFATKDAPESLQVTVEAKKKR